MVPDELTEWAGSEEGAASLADIAAKTGGPSSPPPAPLFPRVRSLKHTRKCACTHTHIARVDQLASRSHCVLWATARNGTVLLRACAAVCFVVPRTRVPDGGTVVPLQQCVSYALSTCNGESPTLRAAPSSRGFCLSLRRGVFFCQLCVWLSSVSVWVGAPVVVAACGVATRGNCVLVACESGRV